jgi:hypothetical protein
MSGKAFGEQIGTTFHEPVGSRLRTISQRYFVFFGHFHRQRGMLYFEVRTRDARAALLAPDINLTFDRRPWE